MEGVTRRGLAASQTLFDDEQTTLVDRATDGALGALPATEWTVLHHVAWPGRRRASIDHVVVGPSGVHVITTQSLRGRVDYVDGALRWNGRARRSALRCAVAAAAAVAAVWPDQSPAPVHGVLCLTGRDGPTASFCCGAVCSTDTLAETLLSKPAVLTEQERRVVVSDLGWLLEAAAGPAYVRPVAGALA